jgi:hypothetical protein
MDKFWPYISEQQRPLPELTDRFNQWKIAISTITEYLVAVQHLDQLHSRELTKMSQRLGEIEGHMGTHTHGVFKHWSIIGTSITGAIQNQEHQLLTLVLKRLDTLKHQVKKKQTYFSADIESFTKRVTKTRTATMQAIEAHEKMQFSRQSNNTSPSSPHATDPWLQERILQQLLNEMIEEENQYQKAMSNLIQEMGVFDSHVVEELKRILEEYGMVRGGFLTSSQATLNNAIGIAVSVENTSYFLNMSNALHLESTTTWKQERTTDAFAFKALDIKILKTGLMYRKNMFGMQYPVQAVLTATGFFHCFEMDRKHPMIEYYTKKNLNRNETVPFMEEQVGQELGSKCDFRFLLLM